MPIPLGPRSTRHSPHLISRLRSSKTVLSPKCRVTPLISTRQLLLPVSLTKRRTFHQYRPVISMMTGTLFSLSRWLEVPNLINGPRTRPRSRWLRIWHLRQRYIIWFSVRRHYCRGWGLTIARTSSSDPGKARLFWVRHEQIGGLGAFAARRAVAKVEPARWVAW